MEKLFTPTNEIIATDAEVIRLDGIGYALIVGYDRQHRRRSAWVQGQGKLAEGMRGTLWQTGPNTYCFYPKEES